MSAFWMGFAAGAAALVAVGAITLWVMVLLDPKPVFVWDEEAGEWKVQP